MYVCVRTQWGTRPPCVPTRTYHCVCTYVYRQVPVLPTVRRGLRAWVSTRGCLCGGPLWRVAFAALPCSVPPSPPSPPLPPLCPLYYEWVPARSALCASVRRCGAPRGPSEALADLQRRSKRFWGPQSVSVGCRSSCGLWGPQNGLDGFWGPVGLPCPLPGRAARAAPHPP